MIKINDIQEMQDLLGNLAYYEEYNMQELSRISDEIEREKKQLEAVDEDDFLQLYRSSSNVSEVHSRTVNKDPLFSILKKRELSRYSRLGFLQRQYDVVTEELSKTSTIRRCLHLLNATDRRIIQTCFFESGSVEDKMEILGLQRTRFYKARNLAVEELLRIYNVKAETERSEISNSVEQMMKEFKIFWNDVSDFGVDDIV